MTLLRLDGFGHHYGAQRALWPLDLALKAGESVAVLGPSGCGKTTLLHAIAGLLDVTEGRIERRWQRLGVMFQQPRLLPWRSALDNLALGLKAQGLNRASRRSTAFEFGARLGLSPAQLAQYPATLSGGMQSRVALGRALAVQPQMLLLDEPFAALDVGLRHELGQLLLAETSRLQCGVMMITHEPREALRLADRLLVLGGQPGQLLLEFVPNRPAVDRREEEILALESMLLGDAAFRTALGLPARSVPTEPRPAIAPIEADSRDVCAAPFSPHLSARHIAPQVRAVHGCQ